MHVHGGVHGFKSKKRRTTGLVFSLSAMYISFWSRTPLTYLRSHTHTHTSSLIPRCTHTVLAIFANTQHTHGADSLTISDRFLVLFLAICLKSDQRRETLTRKLSTRIDIRVDFYPIFLINNSLLFVITKFFLEIYFHMLSENVHLLSSYKDVPVFCQGVQKKKTTFFTKFCDGSHILYYCNRTNFRTQFNFVYFILLAESTKFSSIRKPYTYTSVSDTTVAVQKFIAYESHQTLE